MGRRTAALATVLLCAGCGGTSSTPVQATPRALAAAVIEHIGGHPRAAAPLFPRDRIPRGAWAVEVAFAPVTDVADNTHVRLTLTRSTSRPACHDARCVVVHRDGTAVTLHWDRQEPEEDPGIIEAVAVHDGTRVDAYLDGPLVPADPRHGALADLTDHLVDLVADPDVGFATSPADVEAGRKLSDRVWPEWYGKGNGFPAPAQLHTYYR